MSSTDEKEQLFVIGFDLEEELLAENRLLRQKYPGISIKNFPLLAKPRNKIDFKQYSALIIQLKDDSRAEFKILAGVRKRNKQLPFIFFCVSEIEEIKRDLSKLEPVHIVHINSDEDFRNPDIVLKTVMEIVSGTGREISGKAALKGFTESSWDRYKSLLEHLPVGVYRTTPEGRIIEANRNLAEMLGFDNAEELLNTNVNDLYLIKTDRLEHLNKLVNEPTLFAEHELRRKDGEPIWVRDFPRAIKNITGKIIYYDGILLEITDRKRAEERLANQNEELEAKIRIRTREQLEVNERLRLEVEERKRIEAALRKNEERFKGITERSFDAILEVDWEARIIYASPAFTKIFGYKPEEVIGRQIFFLFKDPENPKMLQGMELIRRGRNLRRLHITAVKKDGSQAEIEFNISPIFQDGKIIGANGNIRDITERKKAERALIRQIDELSVLHDVSKVCVEANDPDELMSRATNIIIEKIYQTNFNIWLVNEKEKVVISHFYYQDFKLLVNKLKIDEGIIGRTVKSGLPIRVDDVSKFDGYIKGDPRTRSELCVPLKIGARVIGVINMEHEKLAAFSEDDERLLVTLAGQLAPSIERLRAEQSHIRQLKELKILHAAAIACVEATDPNELMSRVKNIIVETIKPINFSIWLLIEKEDTIIANSYYQNDDRQKVTSIKLSEGIIGKTVKLGLPHRVDDVSKFEGYFEGDPRTKSELCVPLKVGTRVIGVINTEHEKLAAFSEGDERLLVTLAGQLAPSIERLNAEQSLIRQLKELKVLHAVVMACMEATNPKELMNRVARIVVDTIYTTNFGILLLDEKKEILATHASYYYFEGQSEFEVKLGEGIIGKAARTGLPINAGDVSKFPEYLMGDPHSRSEFCVPVKAGNKVIGVINVESERLNAFSEEDERLLMTIAVQLGLALDGLYKEEQLKNDKELFHNYLDIAGVILIAMDEKLNITLINRKGCQILNLESYDLIGKNWIDACVPERMKGIEREIFDTMLNTSDITYHPVEGYVLTGKGSERMIAWNRSVLKDDSGKITGILSSGEDITIRKELEERLRKSEEEYRTLVQNIRIGVYRSTPDLEGEIIKVNPAAADILGFPATDELIQRKLVDFHFDIQNRKYILDEIKNSGYVKDLEVQMKKNDGSLIWCSLSANGQFDDNGNLIWIDSVLENITEKKGSRDALLAEKERLAVTLRAIGDGVISMDIEGRVVLMNNVASELTGWKEIEAFGALITDVVDMRDPATNEKYLCPLDVILTEGSILDIDKNLNLISKSGSIRIISYSGAPIRDKDSKTIGAVMVFRDVTERTKLEEELLKAQKIESIGFLAGGIAHDFNNILAAVLGNISLARIHIEKQGKSLKYLAESEKAIGRATNLTNQLLTFSKGGDPVKKVVSIRKLLIESVNFSLTGSSIEAQFHIQKDLWNAKVDKDQINQVISNLVLNSVQAMPEGGTIEVCARNIKSSEAKIVSLSKGDYILMEIKDSGSGIREENITKIFDPYFTTKKHGTGLGLAISYSIIKKHKGFIRAESKFGQGTKFSIYLPAFKGKVGSEDQKDMNIKNGSGRILYMDDDNTISETVKDLFSHIGYSVETVNEGSKAVDLYKKAISSAKRFDLVILDLTVPGGMGGKDTLNKLLEIDADVVAIATSGYSNDPIMSNFRSYGFTDTIAKPFRIKEIADVVKRSLAKKSRESSKTSS